MMVQKQSAFGRNCTWNFEFGRFLGLGTCGTIFSRDAGQKATVPSSHTIVRVYTHYTDDHSAPAQPLCVFLSVQDSVHCLRLSTCYY